MTMGATPAITLKGIAWDHPRGYEPLRATSEVFSKKRPEVSIQWDIRSLKEFGDHADRRPYRVVRYNYH